MRTVIDAWADRTAQLGEIPEVEQVFCFENRGPEIGVTLHHPHGQIYAYPYLPARTREILRQAQEHHARTGRLLGRDILDAERADGARVVRSGRHWTAYVPYAARWPVEVHLAPHRDVPDLVALDDAERDELAEIYLDLLARLDRYHESPDGTPVPLPYIAAWHQAPVRTGSRGLPPAPAGGVGAAGTGHPEVPRRLGERRRWLGQRRPARGDRGAAARARLSATRFACCQERSAARPRTTSTSISRSTTLIRSCRVSTVSSALDPHRPLVDDRARCRRRRRPSGRCTR